MTKKTSWAAGVSAAAGVVAAGALVVTLTTPADAESLPSAPTLPSTKALTSKLNATVDKVQADAAKLTTAEKNKLVATKDHAMGSQIQRVEGITKDLGTKLPSLPKLPTVKSLPSIPKVPSLPGNPPAPGEPTNDAPKYGIDVSGHNGNVNWQSYWNSGKRFAYVKATEGTSYTNPYFGQQYKGSYNVGMKRGAYHFATPNTSSGATQAKYFLNHGGGWSRDGKTLPGVIDMEWNPYGSSCYGLSAASMKAWIRDFSNTYHAQTSRYPVIYTSTSWWNQCVGGNHGFQNTNPLWVARYNSSPGAMPSGWDTYTFWQYSDGPPDQNRFNGSSARLAALANG